MLPVLEGTSAFGGPGKTTFRQARACQGRLASLVPGVGQDLNGRRSLLSGLIVYLAQAVSQTDNSHLLHRRDPRYLESVIWRRRRRQQHLVLRSWPAKSLPARVGSQVSLVPISRFVDFERVGENTKGPDRHHRLTKVSHPSTINNINSSAASNPKSTTNLGNDG